MIQPFLVTNNLFGYINDTILFPTQTLPAADKATSTNPTPHPSYTVWLAKDAYVCMLHLSIISEASYSHAYGMIVKDLWLSLQRNYAP
mgnify:CR=1 FL=1